MVRTRVPFGTTGKLWSIHTRYYAIVAKLIKRQYPEVLPPYGMVHVYHWYHWYHDSYHNSIRVLQHYLMVHVYYGHRVLYSIVPWYTSQTSVAHHELGARPSGGAYGILYSSTSEVPWYVLFHGMVPGYHGTYHVVVHVYVPCHWYVH
jgi:hypothetical protein